VPEDWATADDISSYEPRIPSEPLYPGGSTLAIHNGGDLVLVGGVDGVAGVYSLSQGESLQAYKAGSGAITDGLWAGSKAVISTSAGRVKIFEKGEDIAAFDAHAGEATAIALHPCGDILASVGVDKSYVLYDLESNSVLTQIYCDTGMPKRLSSSIHTNTSSVHLRAVPSRRPSSSSRWDRRRDQNLRRQVWEPGSDLRYRGAYQISVLLRKRDLASCRYPRLVERFDMGYKEICRNQEFGDWKQS